MKGVAEGPEEWEEPWDERKKSPTGFPGRKANRCVMERPSTRASASNTRMRGAHLEPFLNFTVRRRTWVPSGAVRGPVPALLSNNWEGSVWPRRRPATD
jgi:hypothetical protein